MKNKCKNIVSFKALKLWRIRASAAIIILYFLIGAIFVFSEPTAIVFGIAAIIIYLLAVILYFPIMMQSCRYFLTDSYAEIEKGVLIRKHTQIRFSSVQYCVLTQSPLQKLFGLCSVELLTAGSSEVIRDISILNGKKIKHKVE